MSARRCWGWPVQLLNCIRFIFLVLSGMAKKPCRICGSNDRFPSGGCRPCAKRRAKTPEERRAYQKGWYSNNKEKNLARTKRWLERNPLKRKDINRQKDVKRRATDGKIPDNIHERLFAEQMGICRCCGDMLGDNYHLDHIMPIALGGTNDESNLQLLRAECNIKKAAMHPDEWYEKLVRK